MSSILPGSPIHSTPLPALVLGSGITALGVFRVLGRRGLKAFGGLVPPSVEKRSRWYARVQGSGRGDDRPTLAEFLEEVPLDAGVLLPCSDGLVLEAASLGPTLAERFPSFLPLASTLEALVDKGTFHEALMRLGIPHPRTWSSEDANSLGDLFGPGRSPCFIKPRLSHRFFAEFGVKGLSPETPDEFFAASERLKEKSIEFLVQEYVPGPPSNHYFIDGFVGADRERSAKFARRRLRMYPPDFGNSTLMVSVGLDEVGEAADHLDRLLDGLGFRGIFSAEFKVDERDGVFRILEINARPWWFVEYAARCGVDVVFMAYQAALGEPVPPPPDSYRIGKLLTHPYYDYDACRSMYPSFPKALASFLSPMPRAHQPLFALDDPIPGVARIGEAAAGFLRRRIAHRLRPTR